MSNETGRAIEIQGVMTALHVLRVLTPELSAIAAALDKKIEGLPSFFANAPVAIDMRDLEPEGEMPRMGSGRLRLGPLVDLLKTRGLVPVAIRGGVPGRVEEARSLGLGVLEWDRASAAKKTPTAGNTETPKPPTATARMTSSTPPAPPPAAPAAPAEPAVALVLSQPLRSGQIVYADEGRDAIALAAVNQGAELIADGNIHVYSTLRGRALAGARGNDQARIFCQRLEPELISIAGVYVNADELPKDKLGKPAQISLRDGSLVISELATR
ncbi:MAG TPA: septum site-determining protein MinC [Polyangiales bacterium]|nr:septum site-determining protein MinC [Polyangiales bacterium]